MIKKLLFIAIAAVAITTTSSAQTTVWDFGNGTEWPVFSDYSTNSVVQNLGVFPGEGVSNIGQVESNNSGTYSDEYTATKRLKFNGASYESSATPGTTLPTKRYFYFAVAGPVTVKVWFKTGGSGTRNLFVTDGTSIIGSLGSTNSADKLILTANYTGGAGNLFITCQCRFLKQI